MTELKRDIDSQMESAKDRMEPRMEPMDLAPKLSPTERGVKVFFLLCAVSALGSMFLIMIFLFMEAAGLFFVSVDGPGVSFSEFFLSLDWYPTYPDPSYGSLALAIGSLSVTFISIIIATPFGIGLAIYLSSVASVRVREWLKPAVELLASIPSVILGFVGMVAVAPFMQNVLDLPTGLNVLNASIFLAIMATPTIASLGDDALSAVSQSVADGSYALGATRWETISRVVVPSALSGLSTAVILGLGRALGETIVVLMVAGGSAQVPHSLFDSVRPLTSTLAAEMGETAIGSLHYHALFALGAVLFLITLAFNLLAFYLARRWRNNS
ncbi:MAG: phosphate ABC transporter permease subunit PstC [Deltaproteobacteria bacterium]|jgi:phosphate transport system permease protein|nr:phosphate ABC transporter permease subunit PstC [Deltaproteobacteria bacterium]